MSEKVVITGMGTVNPLGRNVEETWSHVLEGVSGVGPITLFDASLLEVQVVCEVKDFRPQEVLGPREARRLDRFEQFALIAAREAIANAGLEITEANAHRVGTLVAAAVGGITSLQETIVVMKEHGPRRIGPFAIPKLMPNGASGQVAIQFGAKGPSCSVASACASGADGIGMSWLMLQAGVVDVAITGASEAPITDFGVGAFDRLGALSRRPLGAARTPQPFDRDRDGLVMGEGAAVLVLERESHARARGAPILAELAGYAATSDAYHVTAPVENGAGGAEAMRRALEAAAVNCEAVDYINAHGTGTQLNDAAETQAIKSVFGDLAYNIPVSSTKSMTGHMMGATGALEAVFCVKAIQEQVIPPTINYHTPDPECDLDYVPNQARFHPVRVALSNAFGFGGHNAVLVLREYS